MPFAEQAVSLLVRTVHMYVLSQARIVEAIHLRSYTWRPIDWMLSPYSFPLAPFQLVCAWLRAELLRTHPGYNLHLVGHSLGGGVVSLVAHM